MSCNFMSCIFTPCNLVRHFDVRHFQRPSFQHWTLVKILLIWEFCVLYFEDLTYFTFEGTGRRRLHGARGARVPHFYKWLGTRGTVSRSRKQNKKLTKLYSRKRLPKRRIVLVEPKKWRGTTKFFPAIRARRFPSLSNSLYLQFATLAVRCGKLQAACSSTFLLRPMHC